MQTNASTNSNSPMEQFITSLDGAIASAPNGSSYANMTEAITEAFALMCMRDARLTVDDLNEIFEDMGKQIAAKHKALVGIASHRKSMAA
jgi:hypothetical protein